MDIKYTLSKLSAAVTTTNWQFVQTNRLQYIDHTDTGGHRQISGFLSIQIHLRFWSIYYAYNFYNFCFSPHPYSSQRKKNNRRY